MDYLADVRRTSKQVVAAEQKLKEALDERNLAIRMARAERFGPSVIALHSGLTPEHVRRICVADSDK